MHKRLGANAAAIQLPYSEGDNFLGMIDLIEQKLVLYKDELGMEFETKDIPKGMLAETDKYRHVLLEKIADVDDKVMDYVVHNKELSVGDIKEAIRRTVVHNKFVPVLCGSSFKNKGIQPLLDAICWYLPSPKDLPPVKGSNPETGEFEEITASDKAPFCALCFKIATDPYVGKIHYIRVYSGTVKSGESVYNVSKRVREKITKLVRMHANRQEVIDFVHTGDIAAVVGLKETRTGETLCTEANPILVESMRFPEPVIQQAIEPKTKQDQEKMGFALHKLAEEDPSFRVGYNQETGETVISGMGQLHLEIVIDRIMREFNVEASVGSPQVAYRETITKNITSTGKFIQQSGGRGQYGHVVLEMQPQETPGSGITFEDKIKSGAIPREFIPSVKQGILSSAKSGILSGYPVTDVKIALVDGSFHEVDSSEMAFQMAAAIAFNDGLRKAHSILLEPIMDMEVVAPEEYMGTVIGDLNSRRARIISLGTRGNARIIRANVPLAEIFNYATAIRSLTQGRASYTMEPSFYAEVPSHIAEKITSGFSTSGARKTF
jgi:elongation factor G